MNDGGGIVYLIGAGPGDPDLISVKGKKLLESCDVVVYDALVSDLLIARLPDTIRKISVGKRGGAESAKQADINRILEREAKRGRRVARCKGGDPLVFGRGSEEMEYLAQRGIPYEVVPGITSAIAAPAGAGIPVTHRDVSRSFAVVTGHLREGAGIEELDIPDAETIVVLMAMQHLPHIVEKLLRRGRFSRRTPAALVRNGMLPDQQTVVGTLGTIVGLRDRYGIGAPAVFIVGETVRFSKTLAWRKALPLAGVRVAIVRTPGQSGELIDGLCALGAEVVSHPIMKIVPRKSMLRRVNAALLGKFTMLIFTSPNGAGLFMQNLFENGADARALALKKIYALGAGTAAALREYGIIADGVPEQFVAEGVLSLLPTNLTGEKILVPRAAIAREVLPETLRRRGAGVTVLPVYDTVRNNDPSVPFRNGDYVLFTSSSTVVFFFDDPARRELSIRPVCIGDITAATLEKYYGGPVAVAKNATVPALLEALRQAVRRDRPRKRGKGEVV